MGVDTSTWAEVGVQVERDDLITPFKLVTPEVCHYEDRFDPKTGAKVKPKKIVDKREVITYHFKGKRYTESRALANAVATYLGCKVTRYRDYMCDGWDVFVFGFNHSAYDEYGPTQTDLKPIIDSYPQLVEIQQGLQGLGVKASNPQLIQCMSVS